MRQPSDSVLTTLLLLSLGLFPFSIAMALPALPQIAQAMHTSVDTVILSITIFVAGFSLAHLVVGQLSGHYGRQPALLVACSLFALASFACAAAPSI